MKLARGFATAVFVLVFPLLLFTFNLRLAINSLPLYEYGFDKNQVARQVGLSPQELRQAAQELIRYLNSSEEEIPLELFNPREKIHLRDVQGLVHLVNYVLLGSLAYSLGYFAWHLFREGLRPFRNSLIWGCGLTLAIFLILGLGSLVGFDSLFLQFHLLSFSNPFWMLNPATDRLIVMFPQSFFYEAALLIFAATLFEAGLIGVGAWRWRLRGKGQGKRQTAFGLRLKGQKG